MIQSIDKSNHTMIACKALYRTAISLSSIAADELNR